MTADMEYKLRCGVHLTQPQSSWVSKNFLN